MAMLAPANLAVPKSESADFRIAYICGVIFFGVVIVYLTLTKKLKVLEKKFGKNPNIMHIMWEDNCF